MKVKMMLCITVILASLSHNLHAAQVTIAIVTDGNSNRSQSVISLLEKELSQFEDADYSFRIPENLRFDSQWTYNSAAKHIDNALKNPAVDIVITIGLLSSDAAAKVTPNKPLIAATVINAEQQGFPISRRGSSGLDNFHYLITNVDIAAELARFQRATEAENIGVLADIIIFNALPFLQDNFKLLNAQTEFDIKPIQPITDDMPQLAASLPKDIDALFVLPQDRLTLAQAKALIDSLNQKKIPTFTILGQQEVESGYLMGAGLIPSSEQLAKRLAIDIRDITLGRSASELPVNIDVRDRLSINMQTARKIDFEPPFSILFEANLLNEVPEQGRVLTLYQAVEESLRRNLQLAIAQQDLSSAEQSTLISRSALLPQISANADWQAQDRDLAILRQTRTTSVGIGINQSIYSESNYSGYSSSQFLEAAQKASYAETRLDVIQQTAQAYLNVLTAKTQLDIQQDNLKLTIANLERARFRTKVGAANRSEALRFETELGNDKQAVTDAQSDYQQARNQLNQQLSRPIDELFKTREPGLEEPRIFGDERLSAFLDSNKKVRIFSSFLTSQAIENSPELVNLNNQIKSQDRLLLAAKRKRYVPDVDLTANVDRVIDDNGQPFVSEYDNDWSVGVQFSWTLYQGSRISAERSQASIELQRLKLQYQQTTEQLETDTRNSVLQAGASKLNIEYAQSSAAASEETLELVTDAYVRGTSSYIDLIDAQNSYLTARLASANAVYTHLLDLISVQRSIGFFDFYISPEQQNLWFEQLNEYARNYRKN